MVLIMTRTIKLVDGGIDFDEDNRLMMVGIKNALSTEEIAQRMYIRFTTQKRTNQLHPYDGFDFLAISQISGDGKAKGVRVAPEILIEQEVNATLRQDPEIDYLNSEIIIQREPNRLFKTIVRYSTVGRKEEVLEFAGQLGGNL